MELILGQMAGLQLLNHFFITLLIIIPMVLIARTAVAGTRYSPILIIVIFGLLMGLVLVKTGTTTPGLPEFPIIGLMSKVTIIALIASFFVGGQELFKILSGKSFDIEDIIKPSDEEMVLGTKRTQLVFIVRAFFILIGLESTKRLIQGYPADDILGSFYPLIAYLGLVGSVILIDYKAIILDKRRYIGKGLAELAGILVILLLSQMIAIWIKPLIGLPQIFFAMILSAALGMVFTNWKFGPTLRALLFAGIPVVLAANFIVGGSQFLEAFQLTEMYSVIGYGFFGQIFWMFGGLALLNFLGKANHVRNLAPGMAGALSHSGLTGACTAGDLGHEAAARAPIMINVPFFGHVFVFSILAASAGAGQLMTGWAGAVGLVGIVLTVLSLGRLKKANGNDALEVKGLMLFAFGWQLTAVFGSFLLMHFSGAPISSAAMATSSALSHFGLFAATQGGMFGDQAAGLIPFIFAMPFLVHPAVFGMFGRAATNEGRMPSKTTLVFAIIGTLGVIGSLFVLPLL